MRFFLDENESPAILHPLRVVYFQHQFRSAEEEELRGTLDTDLIREVSARGFHAVLTQDRNQLRNRDERQTYIDTGVHWIGHAEPDAAGQVLIASTAAAYLAAMPHIIEAIEQLSDAHAFHVRNLPVQLGQRLHVRRLKA